MLKQGTPEFVFIKLKNGKYLFLSSLKAVEFLKQQYAIADEQVADMRPIYEERLDGKKGLASFKNILDGIQDLEKSNVLIHCKMGLNRTPVAATIFLVEKMHYSPKEAQGLIEKAMRLRKPDYVLDERGDYTEVLEEVAKRYEQRVAVQLTYRPRQHIREADEINSQKQIWYGMQ